MLKKNGPIYDYKVKNLYPVLQRTCNNHDEIGSQEKSPYFRSLDNLPYFGRQARKKITTRARSANGLALSFFGKLQLIANEPTLQISNKVISQIFIRVVFCILFQRPSKKSYFSTFQNFAYYKIKYLEATKSPIWSFSTVSQLIKRWLIFGFLTRNLKSYQQSEMCGVRIKSYKRFTIFLGRIIIDMLLFKKH